MKSSTYLTWLRRLIVLGAVVAGTVASTAGAVVSRPPDVQDAAAALHFTSAGLKADGLRLQGIAQVYKQVQSVSVPDVFERYAAAHPYGSGLSSVSLSTLVSRPPDVSDAAQAAGRVSFSQSTGFDWGDYAIGIGRASCRERV